MDTNKDYDPEKAPALKLRDAKPSKSKDVLTVTYNEDWSLMRSGNMGRTVHCFDVVNETKTQKTGLRAAYACELFVGEDGEPYGHDNCDARVVCKHLQTSLKELLAMSKNGTLAVDPVFLELQDEEETVAF